ncbi:MAG: glycosyltransferase, partial [Planctomycetes bacterium]|nr:glycosyltransferase [Planctomycetota bacterium]
MKVLQVVHGFLPQFRGGTELYLLGLARALREQGHEVEIVTGTTFTAEVPVAEAYEHDGFRVHKIVLSGSYLEHWTRSLAPRATALFDELLARIAPDVVHVQHWFRLSRALIDTCAARGIPAVCTLHDLYTSCPRIFRIRDEKFCERTLSAQNCLSCVPRLPWMSDERTAAEIDLFREDFENELALAGRIIVPSKAHGEMIQRSITLPVERLRVLPHGTITSLVTRPGDAAVARRLEPSGQGPIRLGIWGHLFHMKGAHLLLEALKLLDPKCATKFRVHIWGEVVEPRYRRRLDDAAEGLDVTWHGAFLPNDIRKVELDLAVLPSLCSESYSFVLDEAFRLGLPAIVAERGALAERIEGAGATFQAESAESLAKVLGELADDPSALARWRAAIPGLVAMSDHARDLAALYREVIDEGPRRVQDARRLDHLRLQHLEKNQIEHERLMFGYLGHIKRETGRADHFEGVCKEVIEDQHKIGAARAAAERLADTERSLRVSLQSKLEKLEASENAAVAARVESAARRAQLNELEKRLESKDFLIATLAEELRRFR